MEDSLIWRRRDMAWRQGHGRFVALFCSKSLPAITAFVSFSQHSSVPSPGDPPLPSPFAFFDTTTYPSFYTPSTALYVPAAVFLPCFACSLLSLYLTFRATTFSTTQPLFLCRKGWHVHSHPANMLLETGEDRQVWASCAAWQQTCHCMEDTYPLCWDLSARPAPPLQACHCTGVSVPSSFFHSVVSLMCISCILPSLYLIPLSDFCIHLSSSLSPSLGGCIPPACLPAFIPSLFSSTFYLLPYQLCRSFLLAAWRLTCSCHAMPAERPGSGIFPPSSYNMPPQTHVTATAASRRHDIQPHNF